MDTDPNPYAAPNEQTAPPIAGAPFSSIACGGLLIGACCMLFAIAGGSVAALLNRIAPGYYPGVFPDADRPRDALSVGIITGIHQGWMFGLVIGVAVTVGLVRFRQLRPAICARAFTVIVSFGIGFAVFGTFAGYLLGTHVPAYYRTVFRGGDKPNFKPVDVGIGLGCSEGLMLGVVVGTLVALALAWRRWRADAGAGLPPNSAVVKERRGRSLVFRLCLGIVHGFVGLVVAFLALFHLCELSLPAFETPFLICVPALCFASVPWFRRYRYSFMTTIVILFIAWSVGQEYLQWLHHH